VKSLQTEGGRMPSDVTDDMVFGQVR